MVTEDKGEDQGAREGSDETNDDAKKDESSHTNGTTIFVRNLPFETRDDQLEKEFSEIGPIKRAFVIKDKDKRSRNRGFGYVQFVLQEDADKCTQTSKSIGNRTLSLTFAAKKPKHLKRKALAKKEEEATEDAEGMEEGEETGNNKTTPSDPNKNESPRVICDGKDDLRNTIVLTGLKERVKRKAFRILCEEFGEIEKIVYPVPEREEVTAFVRFTEYKSAIRATQKIPGRKVRKSGVLSACLLTKENKYPSKKTLQQSRLIIRNLSFQCSDSDLREEFCKFGKVISVNIPTKTVNKKDIKLGCAFVQFANGANAKAALDAMNLKEIKGRQVVLDWAISKELYKEKMPSEGAKTESKVEKDKTKTKTKKGEDKEEKDEGDEVVEETKKKKKKKKKEKKVEEDPPSEKKKEKETKKTKTKKEAEGDDTLNEKTSTIENNDKKKKKKKKKKEEEDNNEETLCKGKKSIQNNERKGKEKESISNKASNVIDDSLEDDDQLNSENDEDEHGSDDEDSEDDKDAESFDEEEEDDDDDEEDHEDNSEDIDEKTKRQLKDAKEGKTVFIRNLSYDVDEEILKEEFEKHGEIDYCKMVYDHESGRSKGSAFIKFKQKKYADGCIQEFTKKEAMGVNIVIDGRPIMVSLAVTKGKLGEIQRIKSDSKKESDKRNIYLAAEGIITRNSPAAEGLSDADLKKREKALAEKKAKLKNPNFFVSRTRLCIRNLPLSTDADDLRAAFMKHVPTQMNIQELKIMRSKERRDLSGVPRSLGFGFIGLETHEDALALLRATNNNPSVFGEKRRPIVEFAVENAKALKILELKKKRYESKTMSMSENNADTTKTHLTKEDRKAKKEKIFEKKMKRFGRYKRKRESMKVLKNKDGLNENAPVIGGSTNTNSEKVFSAKKEATAVRTNVKPVGQTAGGFKRKLPSVMDDSLKRQRKVSKQKDEKEEEKFSSMVEQYKQKLFGGVSQTSKKKNDNRWFE